MLTSSRATNLVSINARIVSGAAWPIMEISVQVFFHPAGNFFVRQLFFSAGQTDSRLSCCHPGSACHEIMSPRPGDISPVEAQADTSNNKIIAELRIIKFFFVFIPGTTGYKDIKKLVAKS